MNLYNVYFVSKGTGPRTVQIEALNSAGVKAQVESRYPGAYNIILTSRLPLRKELTIVTHTVSGSEHERLRTINLQ